MLLRLDRALSSYTAISRSELRKKIRSGAVSVNGKTVRDETSRIDTGCDRLLLEGEPVTCGPLYVMLNKPAGFVSATSAPGERTVLELLPPSLRRKNLFPAGRLDKDTVGFMLLTDDGAFAHAILSPKRHVPKTYFVRACGMPCGGQDAFARAFSEGMLLPGGERCLPAEFALLSAERETLEARVVLHEGMYHQIKRMFSAFGCRVSYLRREKIGGLSLDEALAEGECRALTAEEIQLICTPETDKA
ncbi:MAG: rRNA pseudouridine synthase [Provencibacterium sp.]|jgi:16S rRNA pseudouridine516 synthase|nr:rRNA pseudouridine synthase [Provencibacterium sp.]